MATKVAKSKRPEAERATEHALVELFDCVATRRALRTKFAKVDFFAADVIGVRPTGERLWVQVTAGQIGAVRARRLKLEAYPWHPSDRVFVWQLTFRQSVRRPNAKDWFFRVWEYAPSWEDGKRDWTDKCDPITVPTRWFKVLHSESSAASASSSSSS